MAPKEDEAKKRGFHGGFAANHELAKEAGQKGGAVVRDKYGAQFYRDIGKKGGDSVKEKRGAEYYAEIGRRGGEMRAERLKKAAKEKK